MLFATHELWAPGAPSKSSVQIPHLQSLKKARAHDHSAYFLSLYSGQKIKRYDSGGVNLPSVSATKLMRDLQSN